MHFCKPVVVVLLCIFAAVSQAETLSILSTKTAGLYESGEGTLANGAGNYFFAGRTNQPPGFGLRRGLITFDLSSIPAGATINNATVSLWLSRSADPLPFEFTLHRVAGSWNEGPADAPGQEGEGAQATDGDVTWLHSSYNNALWQNEGGDFDREPSAATIVNTASRYWDWTSAQLAADVQNWMANPAVNNGWLLLGDESEYETAKRFNSDDFADIARRPKLTINYTPIPEPAAAGLLTAVFLLQSRRRRSVSIARRS